MTKSTHKNREKVTKIEVERKVMVNSEKIKNNY